MMKLRSNDGAGSNPYQRSDRIFSDYDSGLWYFRTREGNNIGPFRYRCEAEEMLLRFINGVQAAEREDPGGEKLRFRHNPVPRVAHYQ